MLFQLACSFSFEVLLKLLPSLTCGSSTFHSPSSISLMQGLARGAAERPRECFRPSRSKVSRPGSITGAPLQSVPHGHRDTNTGPGSVAGRHDNRSKTMINNDNPNTPPRGSTLLSFLRRKKEKNEQIRRSSPHTGLQGRLELPPGLRQTPSRASPKRDGRQTRYHLPSRYDGVGADRGHR